MSTRPPVEYRVDCCVSAGVARFSGEHKVRGPIQEGGLTGEELMRGRGRRQLHVAGTIGPHPPRDDDLRVAIRVAGRDASARGRLRAPHIDGDDLRTRMRGQDCGDRGARCRFNGCVEAEEVRATWGRKSPAPQFSRARTYSQPSPLMSTLMSTSTSTQLSISGSVALACGWPPAITGPSRCGTSAAGAPAASKTTTPRRSPVR